MKTAILLYLYHLDLWDEYKNLILNNCSNYDLFLSLCSDNDNRFVIKDCKKTFKNCIIQKVDNKGIDIGPFLKQLEVLDEKKYPFFIKLHSKKSLINKTINWRIDHVNSLIGSKETYLKNLKLINQSYAGCICNKSFLNKNQSKFSNKIKEILKIIKVNYNEINKYEYPVGGMFISKTKLFKKYFNSKNINRIYNKLEGGRPEENSYNHALEVINGYLFKIENLKILDGVVESKVIYNPSVVNNKIHLIRLYNNEYVIKENVFLRGFLEEDNNIFWKHLNLKQKYKSISGNKLIKKNNSSFDCTLYKLLNKEELKNIPFEDLEDDYKNFGEKEGRIIKEDIVKVFDENFYQDRYDVDRNRYKEIFQNYIKKGFFEGRLYNPIILKDNFDYGFYQSYHNIFNNKNYNQYTSLYEYILTKNKCNNEIKYKNCKSAKKVLCIYSCKIVTKKDFYFLKTNLNLLEKSFEKIIVINSSSFSLKLKNKNVVIINTKIKNDYKKYISILKTPIVRNYTHICLLKDNLIVVKNLNNFLKKSFQSDCVLYSTQDCYINKYHIDDSILIFSKTNLNIIKNALLKSKNKIELSSFLIKKGHKIGSFFQINQVKELFWKNLFIDINMFPGLLLENNVPVLDKISTRYLLNLIPNNFKKIKNQGKIQSFFKIKLDKKNINNIFKINLDKIKFCLIFHIKNIKRINEYEKFLNLLKSKINVDVIITTNSINQKEFINNKGMDIGPFIKTMSKINKKYDYVIKLHGKSFKAFREACFNNIINLIYHHILLLETNHNLICSGPRVCRLGLDQINKPKIDEFLLRNNIFIKETENNFFAGTMFIAKYSLFKDFLKIINSKEEYDLLEEGPVVNNTPTYTHAWERILTNIIPNYYGMKNNFI